MGLFTAVRDPGVRRKLAEACQPGSSNPSSASHIRKAAKPPTAIGILLSCAKKNGVGRQEEVAQRKPLERVSSGLLRKQRGAAPLPPPRSCPARKTSNGAPSCLPSGEGGLAKRGRMRVGEQYQAALPYRWCFKTLIRLPLVGTFPGGEGFGACVPARCCTQTSDTNYARPARIFAEQKCLAVDKSSKFAARQKDR